MLGANASNFRARSFGLIPAKERAHPFSHIKLEELSLAWDDFVLIPVPTCTTMLSRTDCWAAHNFGTWSKSARSWLKVLWRQRCFSYRNLPLLGPDTEGPRRISNNRIGETSHLASSSWTKRDLGAKSGLANRILEELFARQLPNCDAKLVRSKTF